MDTDDVLIGRVLPRHEMLELLAMSAAAVIVGCRRGGDTAADTAVDSLTTAAVPTAPMPGCIVRPELTVGPYFVDQQLDRSDVRIEPSTGAAVAGIPLAITLNVSHVASGACTPLAGAMVDLWQCDAEGRYSAVNDQMLGVDTSNQKFLRGYQITGPDGVARFTTIYPG